jgi:hypothetical protein
VNPNDLSTSPRASATNPAASGVPGLAPESSLHFLRKDEAGAEANGVGAVNALAVVLLVAGLLFWFLRRLGVARAGVSAGNGTGWQRMLRLPEGGNLKVLQSTRLTPKASAHVLEWGQGRWLIVCNDGATTVVASQPGDAPAAQAGVAGEGR